MFSKSTKFCAIGVLAAFIVIPTVSAKPIGSPAPEAEANRTVQVREGYMNVKQGETVEFVKDGQSVTWRFDEPGAPTLHLFEIAPEMGTGRDVHVSVWPDFAERS